MAQNYIKKSFKPQQFLEFFKIFIVIQLKQMERRKQYPLKDQIQVPFQWEKELLLKEQQIHQWEFQFFHIP